MRPIIRLTSLLLLAACGFIFPQSDSTKNAVPTTGIEDSTVVIDSTMLPIKYKTSINDYNHLYKITGLKSCTLQKSKIDFQDYRYSGNLIQRLPFGFLSDFGSLGTPNEPKLFSNGSRNISILFDGISVANEWNNSQDLNRVQTEDINLLQLSTPVRGFLFGFNNNLSALSLQSIDSLKSKPISRIRYYQGSNEEGFIDAMFNAKVLPKMSMYIRVTNNSVDDSYLNTDYGAWKVKLRAVYKIADSLFARVNYYHLKLNTPLNGGINIESLSLNTNGEYDIYSTQADVNFPNRNTTTSTNNISASFHGSIIPFGNSIITLSYINNEDIFKNDINDSTKIKNINKYDGLKANMLYETKFNNINGKIIAGFSSLNNDLESLAFSNRLDNYYSSAIIDIPLLDSLILPGAFGKYSYYNRQHNYGYGFDVKLNLSKNLTIMSGHSYFDKPLSLIETIDLGSFEKSNMSTFFSTVEYINQRLRASVSYFYIENNNAPIPLYDEDQSSYPKVIYSFQEDIENSGINVNSVFELWNVLLYANFNYNFNSDDSKIAASNKYQLNAGIYYVDTLFNSNLNLKTGFTLYMNDNPNPVIYDFERMRSASYSTSGGSISRIQNYNVINDNYRIDFMIAGRIQNTATFYLTYENLLGSTYYVVPYYPMPEGGLRIGLAWDFLD